MKRLTYLTALLPVLLVSCSPRIVTTVIKPQPALGEKQRVTIYKDKEQVPDGYELLGTVKVGDAGATTDCDSLRMINLVKAESRKMGGNAVLITEHKLPSFWGSTCHQFKGLVLNIPKTKPSNERNMELETAAISLSKQRTLPRFTFSANVGPAWRTDKVAGGLDDFAHHFYEKMRLGFQTNISADYFFSDYYGIRLAYQNFYTFHTQLATNGYVTGDLKGIDIINAVYPAFVARLSTPKRKWLFDVSLGIGYISLAEKFDFPDNTSRKITGSTVCWQSTIETEYRFSENWGLGLGVFSTNGALSDIKINDNGHIETVRLEDYKEGLNHVSVLLGLKYHIK